MLEIKKGKTARDTVKKVFNNINDMVVPTMGAKGLLVALDDDFGKCTLTDDGVTVARQAIYMDGLEKMIAVDMIEAAATTEKEALDGTTLTILMTNALYDHGYKMIRKGKHPQIVADKIEKEVGIVRTLLKNEKFDVKNKHIKSIATISTKIPAIGEIVDKAYSVCGPGMNVVIEHDREGSGIKVEQTKGFSIDSGYMSDAMAALCEDGESFEAENAWIVLLKEGILTQVGIGNFFKSIPEDEIHSPFIFVLNPAFNPNTLRLLIDTLIKNGMKYQFIFVNETKMDDVYMDLGAVTKGKVQDASTGIGDYLFEDCGHADKVKIDIDRSLFICDKNPQVTERIKQYKKKLNKKYKLSGVDEALYTKRLGALENGVVKIKVGVPTVTEFKTLHLKLDDAIGAVRKAIENGVVLGGGKALYNVSLKIPNLSIKKLLQLPMKQILNNAGVKNIPRRKIINLKNAGIDVRTNELVSLYDAGILDSYTSIDEALKNATSIACSYLRTNSLIKKETTQNK